MFIVVKYFGDPTYRKWVSDLFHLRVDTPMARVHTLRDIIPTLSPPGPPSGTGADSHLGFQITAGDDSTFLKVRLKYSNGVGEQSLHNGAVTH